MTDREKAEALFRSQPLTSQYGSREAYKVDWLGWIEAALREAREEGGDTESHCAGHPGWTQPFELSCSLCREVISAAAEAREEERLRIARKLATGLGLGQDVLKETVAPAALAEAEAKGRRSGIDACERALFEAVAEVDTQRTLLPAESRQAIRVIHALLEPKP